MLIILEVLLTITAWRKGWKALALLPLAIGVPIGVFLTVNSNSLAPAFVVDVLITITLGVMSANSRKPATQPAPVPVEEVTRQNAA